MPTKIPWADDTWNPIVGCTPISEGCVHCYARSIAHRFKMPGWEGQPVFKPERLAIPAKWKKPRRIFVNSMGDLFHSTVKIEWVDEVFREMRENQRHTFLVLTKRPWAMRDYMLSRYNFPRLVPGLKPPNNIWLGVTAENQERADERIPALLETPSALRFVSVEPMLGPVDLSKHLRGVMDVLDAIDCSSPYPSCNHRHAVRKLDWVICGAETGMKRRMMDGLWPELVRKQCQDAGVPYFGKTDSWNQEMEPREWPKA
jgi:protein gp37